jgi:1,4-dihydroxy-2-naphthoyl-CoA synthase
MDYTSILTSTEEGGVGLARLNRPQQLNALNSVLMEELAQALEAFDRDDAVRCIVITGNEKAFAAGADIKETADASPVEMLLRDNIARWDRLRRIKKPSSPPCPVTAWAAVVLFPLCYRRPERGNANVHRKEPTRVEGQVTSGQ